MPEMLSRTLTLCLVTFCNRFAGSCWWRLLSDFSILCYLYEGKRRISSPSPPPKVVAAKYIAYGLARPRYEHFLVVAPYSIIGSKYHHIL